MFHTNWLRVLNIIKTHTELLETDETIKIRLDLSQNEVLCLGQRDPGMGLIKTRVWSSLQASLRTPLKHMNAHG